MKRAVKSFGAKLREAGSEATGLFYYAGHGVQVEGTNFLLPVDAEIAAEADVEIESIAADDVMTQMQSAGNAVNLVFLDACRNNPLARTSRSATRGLARLDAPRGSFVGYSTAPGDVAADGDGANSPYALALVDELKTPGISIEEAHRNVRAKVLARSGNKQTPWDSSSLTGPVVLAAKVEVPAPQPVAQPAPEPQVQQQAAVDKEVVFWESIKGSQDPAEYEAYLQQYPQGTFALLARAKKSALETPPAPAVPATQQAAIADPASGAAASLTVSPQVRAEIDQYLRSVTVTKASSLAIARDGTATARASCWPSACVGYNAGLDRQKIASRAAIKNCGGPAKCILLYEGNRKAASIEIVTRSGAALDPQATPEPSPASIGEADVAAAAASGGDETAEAGTFAVSSDVKAQIDQYLNNAAGGPGAWAFAISKDGTAAAYSHCGSGASAGCQHLNNPVIEARKAAMHKCGGAGKCIVLYEGTKKVISGEIVVQ
jgi:uncharacterized caspase-like protein